MVMLFNLRAAGERVLPSRAIVAGVGEDWITIEHIGKEFAEHHIKQDTLELTKHLAVTPHIRLGMRAAQNLCAKLESQLDYIREEAEQRAKDQAEEDETESEFDPDEFEVSLQLAVAHDPGTKDYAIVYALENNMEYNIGSVLGDAQDMSIQTNFPVMHLKTERQAEIDIENMIDESIKLHKQEGMGFGLLLGFGMPRYVWVRMAGNSGLSTPIWLEPVVGLEAEYRTGRVMTMCVRARDLRTRIESLLGTLPNDDANIRFTLCVDAISDRKVLVIEGHTRKHATGVKQNNVTRHLLLDCTPTLQDFDKVDRWQREQRG